jgi:hypothetical protein
VTKRDEFYRHVASTRLPCIELVVALRAQLLPHKSIALAEAKEIAIRNHKRPLELNQQQLNDQIVEAVSEQLLADAQTITDIAQGFTLSDKGEKVELGPEDRLEHGWMAVRMPDGGQRLVLVEIAALTDIERTCIICRKSCRKRCGRCNVAFYCSNECQTKDWKQNNHGSNCNPSHKTALHELRTILAHDFQPIVITCPPPPPPTSTKHHKNPSRNKPKIYHKQTPPPA